MKCVKVSLKHAEEVKNKLLDLGVFDYNYKIFKDKNHIYFPVNYSVKYFDIVDKKLTIRKPKLTLKEALLNKLTKKEFSLLVKSYDLVGKIAILEINRNLLKKKKIIAKVLLDTNKNIKTVVRKVGEHKGEYRTQNYEFLLGEKKFETLHKENGVLLNLNIKKVYYSPRSSNERLRISTLVKTSESVLVMFSGIGVCPLVISKHSSAREIYGIEINPDACKYADKNLKLNHIKNVKFFCCDVKKVLPKLNKKFDRIIMPLPKTSSDFIELALKFLNKKGFIHFYCFSTKENIKDIANSIREKCGCSIINIVKAGQQSPRTYRYCIDFKL